MTTLFQKGQHKILSVFHFSGIKRRIFPCFIACILLLTGFSFLTGCQNQDVSKKSVTGFYFDTVITITLYDNYAKETYTRHHEMSKTEITDELLTGCTELAKTCESTLSRTVKGSDIWNINHSNGTPVTVSDTTLFLLKKALHYAELSDGMVDPSIGSLSTLWNFGESNEKSIPSEEEITLALSHVNYKDILIQNQQVTLKDPEMILDLGFIAKGYIADLMKEYLVSEGVQSAIINLGGNVLTIGAKPDGSSFQVGIQKPFAESGTALFSLPVSDCSLVSSGNYERCFTKDDILYHHILSTKNGYPAGSGLSQVTILSESSVDGDALSTLCFLLGYEKGKELIDSLENTEAVFVTTEGEILKTF